jgi:hypothetical protein
LSSTFTIHPSCSGKICEFLMWIIHPVPDAQM